LNLLEPSAQSLIAAEATALSPTVPGNGPGIERGYPGKCVLQHRQTDFRSTDCALAQLCNSLHRVLKTADLEARLARLEQQLAEQESRTSVDTDATALHRQEEGYGGTDAQPGDVYTPGSGDGAEGRNDGSGKDEKA